jgi:polar amino acid transport system substrate-binding protein
MGWRGSRWGAGILVGAGILALAAWEWFASGDDALARIRSSGTIRIGYAVEAPYALLAADGRVTGESPELARLVTTRMGIPNIEWIQASFDALLPELADGRFDVVAAGLFISPQRERIAAFSAPTVQVFAGLAVPAGAREYGSYTEVLAEPELRVAALSGSVEEARLLARGLPPTRLLRVPDAVAARAALESGQVDVLALSLPTLRWMIADGASITTTQVAGRAVPTEPPTSFKVGFAFARGESRLRDTWNVAQTEVKGGPGHLAAIAPFGFTAADLAGSEPR